MKYLKKDISFFLFVLPCKEYYILSQGIRIGLYFQGYKGYISDPIKHIINSQTSLLV